MQAMKNVCKNFRDASSSVEFCQQESSKPKEAEPKKMKQSLDKSLKDQKKKRQQLGHTMKYATKVLSSRVTGREFKGAVEAVEVIQPVFGEVLWME